MILLVILRIPLSFRNNFVIKKMCVCVCVYIFYIYIYIHIFFFIVLYKIIKFLKVSSFYFFLNSVKIYSQNIYYNKFSIPNSRNTQL